MSNPGTAQQQQSASKYVKQLFKHSALALPPLPRPEENEFTGTMVDPKIVGLLDPVTGCRVAHEEIPREPFIHVEAPELLQEPYLTKTDRALRAFNITEDPTLSRGASQHSLAVTGFPPLQTRQEVEEARVLARRLSEWCATPPRKIQAMGMRYLGALDVTGAEIISEILKRGFLTELDVEGSRLRAEGAKALAEVLKHDKKLRVLNIACNRIEAKGAVDVASAISSSCSLERLELQSNGIGDSGATSISRALRKQRSLIILNLGRNGVGDRGAEELCKGLRLNSRLQELILEGNVIGPQGARRLGQIFSPSASHAISRGTGVEVRQDERDTFSRGTVVEVQLDGENTWFALVSDVPSAQDSRHKITFLDDEGKLPSSGTKTHELSNFITFLDDSGKRPSTSSKKLLLPKKLLNLAQFVAEPNNMALQSLMLELPNNFVSEPINTTLQCLNLASNSFTASPAATEFFAGQATEQSGQQAGDSAAARLVESLAGNQSLTSLSLRGNDLGPMVAHKLAHLMSKKEITTLRNIDLGSNDIGSQGATSLAKALQMPSCPLRTLDLSFADVTNEGIKMLGDSLAHNTNLTALHLDGCRVVGRGTALTDFGQRLVLNSTLSYLSGITLVDHADPDEVPDSFRKRAAKGVGAEFLGAEGSGPQGQNHHLLWFCKLRRHVEGLQVEELKEQGLRALSPEEFMAAEKLEIEELRVFIWEKLATLTPDHMKLGLGVECSKVWDQALRASTEARRQGVDAESSADQPLPMVSTVLHASKLDRSTINAQHPPTIHTLTQQLAVLNAQKAEALAEERLESSATYISNRTAPHPHGSAYLQLSPSSTHHPMLFTHLAGELGPENLEEDMRLEKLKESLLYNDSNLSTVILNERSLGDSGAGIVAGLLEHNELRPERLYVERNGIGPCGATRLARALASNTSITELYMGSNAIGDEGAMELSSSLCTASSVLHLGLEDNGIGLERPGLDSEPSKPNGIEFLAHYLALNPRLTQLNLTGNLVHSSTAACLYDALIANSNLTSLDLGMSKLGPEGLWIFSCGLSPSAPSLHRLSGLEVGLSNPIFLRSSVRPVGFKHGHAQATADPSVAQSLSSSASQPQRFSVSEVRSRPPRLLKPPPNTKWLRMKSKWVKDLWTAELLSPSAVPQLSEQMEDEFKSSRDVFEEDLLGSTLTRPPNIPFNTTLSQLGLRGCELGPEGVRPLANALSLNFSIIDLHLGNNALGDQGAIMMGNCLTLNTSLTRLNLEDNCISGLGARGLAAGLLLNSTLGILDLKRNTLRSSGAGWLAQALSCSAPATLTRLSLAGNRLGDEGAQLIANGLALNTCLLSLNLAANHIDDEGVDSLATCLPSNSTLQSLDLSFNSITDVGAHLLAECFHKSSPTRDLQPLTIQMLLPGAADSASSSTVQAALVNTTLTNLELTNNLFGPKGVDSLKEALQLSKSGAKIGGLTPKP